jgi:hypothetical protein
MIHLTEITNNIYMLFIICYTYSHFYFHFDFTNQGFIDI